MTQQHIAVCAIVVPRLKIDGRERPPGSTVEIPLSTAEELQAIGAIKIRQVKRIDPPPAAPEEVPA